ncbi:MAG: sugar phosphate nucleotidyltransferase, partial [Verrucomicrobiota bacterium]
TGLESMTGGRLRRVKEYLDDEPFCMTYGDGVSDVNISESIAYHKEQGALATMTAIKPPGRFGAFALHPDDKKVSDFVEKPQGDGAWINGGYFVLDPKVIDYIPSDLEPWEKSPMQKLARDGQMAAYRHTGFWQPMDTLRDKMVLEELWESGKAPWKTW